MKYPKRKCAAEDCEKGFTPIRKDQKFCSPRCSNRVNQQKHYERRKAVSA